VNRGVKTVVYQNGSRLLETGYRFRYRCDVIIGHDCSICDPREMPNKSNFALIMNFAGEVLVRQFGTFWHYSLKLILSFLFQQ